MKTSKTMFLTEEKIAQLIEEEIERMIEEGLMQDIASKASTTIKALALAATLGGAGMGTAHAAPGQLQSTETPITSTTSARNAVGSRVAQSLAEKINNLNLKDKYGLKIEVDSSQTTELGEITARMYNEFGHGNQTIDDYTDATLGILKVGFDQGVSEGQLFSFVHKLLVKKMKKRQKKKRAASRRIRITKTEHRNNPLIVQQAVLGIFVDANQGKPVGPALDNLSKQMIRAVKDGDMTKAEAKKVYDVLRSKQTPDKQMDQITKILKLDKK